MNRLTAMVGAMLAGAGAMFLLDPDRGARRRALAWDQATSARRRFARTLQATLEDARNRAAGTLAEAQQRFRAEPIDDAQLVERVRARIGLVCAEPTKVEVTAANGCVTLRGTVPRVEIAPIVHSAKWTRGVRMVDEQLTTDDAETGS